MVADRPPGSRNAMPTEPKAGVDRGLHARASWRRLSAEAIRRPQKEKKKIEDSGNMPPAVTTDGRIGAGRDCQRERCAGAGNPSDLAHLPEVNQSRIQ